MGTLSQPTTSTELDRPPKAKEETLSDHVKKLKDLTEEIDVSRKVELLGA